jgi:hypothetical protein
MPDSEARLTAVRERITKIVALFQQRAAAQAAASSGD